MIGQRFGKLTVISISPERSASRHLRWVCKCDCGREHITIGSKLKNGKTRSCGCSSIGSWKTNFFTPKHSRITHGLTNHPLYTVWRKLRERCLKEKSKDYHYYGGRGITVCDEWENSFQAFYEWAVNHGYQKGLVIDRINNNLGYYPNNCRFVTVLVNNLNKRGAKLDFQKAQQIRILFQNGIPKYKLSKQFSVHRNTITRVLKKSIWDRPECYAASSLTPGSEANFMLPGIMLHLPSGGRGAMRHPG